MTGDEQAALMLALRLTGEHRFACFPVLADGSPGGDGIAASIHRLTVQNAWLRRPGPYVGVVCGAPSGICAISAGSEAMGWLEANLHRLLPTLAYAGRDGGVVLFFAVADRRACAANPLAAGVTVLGEGAFVVLAPDAECLDPSPPAPWPTWEAPS